jgi:hypothetical protein
VQKRSLNAMTRIDTNIFRDISSTTGAIPSDEAIAQEFKNANLKVIRVKSAIYWLSSITLKASEPDWHRKQQA